LYLAGRMHKPVLHLRNDARVQLAQVQNLKTAVRMALLMLPTEFSEEDLFMTLAGLSYQGDIRMGVAENPRKVYNIVQGQFSEFQSLYKHVIEDLPNVNYVSDGQLQVCPRSLMV
jgi:translocator assembly and maintenance protein 41